MSRHDFAFITCRVLALMLFGWAALRLFVVVVFVLDAMIEASWRLPSKAELATLLPFVFALIVGLTLWMLSGRIAPRLIPNDATESPPLPMDAHSLLVVACSVIGIVVLVLTIDRIMGMVGSYIAIRESRFGLHWESRDYEQRMENWWMTARFAFLGAAVQIAVGVFLLIGNRGIAGCVLRLRTAGQYTDDR